MDQRKVKFVIDFVLMIVVGLLLYALLDLAIYGALK